MSICWRDELLVGHDAIDTEHRDIVSAIARLYTALDEQDAAGEVTTLLGTVIDLMSGHYEREEVLMRTSHFPGVERHSTEHNQFFSELTRLLALMERGAATVADDLRRCLRGWAFDHVLIYDKPLGRFLAGRASRA